MKKQILSRKAEETLYIGKIIGSCLTAGDVVALIGELGAGKTSLTQGIARGLEISESYAITSPTFTLINEYPGRHVLYHFDVYRLQGSNDLEDMGYEEYFYGKGVSVIEWAEKIADIIPETAITIEITFLDENTRRIEISAPEKRLEEISSALSKGGF
ncbi:tRNA (adenosine(37)-N6)-threonylcarbamoyltransferase complex ATPase subunit type 1 TsaE [Syntrophus aciditrophicus]|uniref:tRNA threonylcarbamoyladenosine biosynthesis protein TsaE n=1 Tax=Syntrophus aciditrophicus (strain SB) TaxID=56780 RepID=Q2LTJ6_SYNAS|nr:tRNA (adenosine(37)-N6)-threonylcarbamoyltransferase complex ATPase subunit type 1 TsaE [Syntrophus aciditrophicus]ABC77409.1 ATP/GTP hydrolase [Syntrophus aciditrophicus SB]OPY19098.1 MAG: tRNA threonylcarbamoyladenosine biosynthesis protein TsaE [Syntrophus sp. PtaB.Bin075]